MMEGLAIFGIVMMIIISLGLQHVCNWLVRTKVSGVRETAPTMFVLSMAMSLGLLYSAILLCIEIW